MRIESLIVLTLCATLAVSFINVVPLSHAEPTSSYSFIDFVKEIFENVPNATAYRYDAKDDQGCGLDTIKIVENPLGGYLGVYHFNVCGIFQVRLAKSMDLRYWNFIKTIEFQASQPTIAQAPNGAYVVVFEKEDATGSHLKLHYYLNASQLIDPNSRPNHTIDLPKTLSYLHEGTPNVYNITIQDIIMTICIGFHFDNGTVDNVAVGWLKIRLDNFKWWWNTTEQKEYNDKLRRVWGVKGNIGDRDYRQIFGRNFTLQEGCLVKRNGHWAYYRIFLYDHLTCNFTMLNIKTHGGSTSFGNPTFTFLKSPKGKECIVVTYFIFNEGAAPGESGELIFYKELEWEGRGIWVWAESFSSDPNVGPMQIRDVFHNFSEAGLNFVLFLVKNSNSSGWLFYNSSIGPVDPRYYWDPLKVAVEEAHRFGLELHAWFCVFRDKKLAKERPDLAMVNCTGYVSTEWVCPKKPEVHKYLKSLIEEVASKYNVDGIHLDYIRFPNRTYCYCEDCRRNWLEEHPEKPWPPDPADPTFIGFRQKLITGFIEDVRNMLKGINPKIKLSAAVLPVPKDAIYNRMQNYPEWAERGIIDFITPMAYTSNAQEFEEWIKGTITAAKGKTLIYAGIGLYKVLEAQNPEDEFRRQINITRTVKVTVDCSVLGVDGQVLFRYKYLEPFINATKEVYSQHAYTPHSETIPPQIGEPIQDPPRDNAQPFQNVTITVNVTDYPTRIRKVILHYSINNGTKWNAIVMKQVCQNTYQATIPGYEYCIWVTYKIEACDIVGNNAIRDKDGYGYKYHVIPEFPSALIFTSFMLTTTSTMALWKIKRKRSTS
jgi:uncharacterized lipoprotein YddW (UPF0748 family)